MMGWIAAAVIAILGAFGIFVALRARGVASAESDALRNEMQSLLAAQSQATAAQISQLAQSLTAQLGQVSQQVQSGMASVGTIATSAQKAVSEQLQASTQMLTSVHRQIGEMQQAGHELSVAAKQIEDFLSTAIAGCSIRARNAARIFLRLCACTPNPSPKNTFCRGKKRSISP